MDLQGLVRDFKSITELSDVRLTLEVVINADAYRLELMHSHTNAKAPWAVYVYETNENDAWEHIDDFPWVMERDEDSALRAAMTFLDDWSKKRKI